jgi:hypothetical protein
MGAEQGATTMENKTDPSTEESDDVIDSILQDLELTDEPNEPDTSQEEESDDGDTEYITGDESEASEEEEGEPDTEGDEEAEEEEEDFEGDDDEADDDLASMEPKELQTLVERERKRSKDSRDAYHRERNRNVELEKQLEEARKSQQEAQEEDIGEKPDILEDPDAYEEWVNRSAEIRAKKAADTAIAEERQRLREAEQVRDERQMKKDRSDYDSVVTEAGVKEINEDPLIQAAFQSLVKEHGGNIARAAYETLKRRDRIRAALQDTELKTGEGNKKRRTTSAAKKSPSGRPLKDLKKSNDDDPLAGLLDEPESAFR